MEQEYEVNTSERHSLVFLIEVKVSSICLILYALASERFVIVDIQMRSGILVSSRAFCTCSVRNTYEYIYSSTRSTGGTMLYGVCLTQEGPAIRGESYIKKETRRPEEKSIPYFVWLA